MTMWHDESESWDNKRGCRITLPADYLDASALDFPCLRASWRGPTNPDEARAADRIMVDLGRVLLLQNTWELDEEMRRLEKRNGF